MSMPGQTGKFVLLLCLIIVAFYSPILFSSQFSVLTALDQAAMDYPWYNYLASSLHSGHIPLWDPYSQGGRSFVGESATGAFSPIRWTATLLLSKDGAISSRSMQVIFVFLHGLAAILMFALIRTMGLSRFAALFGGLCFSLAGYAGNVLWFDMVESIIWLPLVFLFQLKAFQAESRSRRICYALISGLGIGMAELGGRMHIVILDALLVIAAGIYYGVSNREDSRKESRKEKWLSAGLVVGVIGICSFAASALQLIPSIEWAREVNRWIGAPVAVPGASKIPYAYLNQGYSPRALFSFLFPFIDSGPGELNPFFGVLPFCLAFIGVWKNWGNRWVRFLTGVAVIGFLYSMGGYFFVHRIAYLVVPYIWLVRDPSRFIYLTHFAGAILAGFGLDTVLSKTTRQESFGIFMKGLRWCVIGSAAIVGTLVLLRRPEASDLVVFSFISILGSYLLLAAINRGRRTTGISFLIVALTVCEIGVLDLYGLASLIEIRAQGADHTQRLEALRPVASFLKRQPGLFRVHVEAENAPNLGDFYQVQATFGGMTATALKSFDKLVYQCGRLDLLNVKYLVRESKAAGQAIFEADGWKVVESPSGYPRAWLVHQAVVQPSAGKALENVCRREIDLLQTAIIDAPLETKLDSINANQTEQVRVQSYEAGRIELEARANGRSMLVLSEMYFPGWVADLNGIPVKINKVDGALRGIIVPAGTSRVVLRYAPRSVAWGAGLTLLAFAGTLVFGVITFRRKCGRPA